MDAFESQAYLSRNGIASFLFRPISTAAGSSYHLEISFFFSFQSHHFQCQPSHMKRPESIAEGLLELFASIDLSSL